MHVQSIDFIITWVDGNDPAWREEFNHWRAKVEGDDRELRYRDWGTLSFLFRAFEKFTPWVRKVHLVTWGHVPKWLNLHHAKLSIIKHEEFLKSEFLPTFNINPIEVNLHKIPHLSSRFVYFNDDMFVLKNTSPERFFCRELPRDIFALNAISPNHPIAHININNLKLINNHFVKKKVMKKLFVKWFRPSNGVEFLKTILLLPWPQFTGFYDPHQPQPFLKSTFEEVWEKEKTVLKKTSSSKLRNEKDVNQYLFRYWQLVKGEFHPVSFNDSHSTSVRTIEDAYAIADIIRGRHYRMLCINDAFESEDNMEFEKAKETIISAFEDILPQKSSFEL